jgi:hypothetical protein
VPEVRVQSRLLRGVTPTFLCLAAALTGCLHHPPDLDKKALKQLSNYVAYLPDTVWIGTQMPDGHFLCFEDGARKLQGGPTCITLGQARAFAYGLKKTN